MSFLVYGGDPFIQADIAEMLSVEYLDSPVKVANSEDELRECLSDLTGPVVAILAVHQDVVNLTNIVLKDREKAGRVILIRNDPPDDEEKKLPLDHLAKPFSSRELIALVRNARSALLGDR